MKCIYFGNLLSVTKGQVSLATYSLVSGKNERRLLWTETIQNTLKRGVTGKLIP